MLLSAQVKSVLAIEKQASRLKQYEQNNFPFQLMGFQVAEERENERLWCDLLCSSYQPQCLGNACRMSMLAVPSHQLPGWSS